MKNSCPRLIITLFFSFLCDCAIANKTKYKEVALQGTNSNQEITVVAVIKDFREGVMNDTSDDSSKTTIYYDGIYLLVESPREFKNKEFTFYDQRDMTGGPIWRQKGQRITFKIDRNSLAQDSIFTGVVRSLKSLDPKSQK